MEYLPLALVQVSDELLIIDVLDVGPPDAAHEDLSSQCQGQLQAVAA